MISGWPIRHRGLRAVRSAPALAVVPPLPGLWITRILHLADFDGVALASWKQIARVTATSTDRGSGELQVSTGVLRDRAQMTHGGGFQP